MKFFIFLFTMIIVLYGQTCETDDNCTSLDRPYCNPKEKNCGECKENLHCETKFLKVCGAYGYCKLCDEGTGDGCQNNMTCLSGGYCSCNTVEDCETVSTNHPSCNFDCVGSKCICTDETRCSPEYPIWISDRGCGKCTSDDDCTSFPNITCNNKTHTCVPIL